MRERNTVPRGAPGQPAVTHPCGDGVEMAADTTAAFCRQVVEHSPDCIKLLDRDGRLLWMNPPGLRLMEICDVAAVLGSPWVGFWGTEVQGLVLAALETARGGGSGRFTGPCPTGTGRMKWWNVVVVPVAGPEGHFLVISRDVTEMARALEEQNALAAAEHVARQEAEQATAAKDDLLAVVSHEMRTPVSAILGWAVLLQARSSDPVVVDMAQQIERIAEHELQLVSDVIDQHRGTSQGAIPLEPLSVSAVLRDVIQLVLPITDAKRLRVALHAPEDAAWIRGDARRLRQVFLNLLSNSVKFTAAGGQIDFALQLLDQRVRVTVRDTGVGIEPDFLGRVFDRFVQEDVIDVRRHGGLGLGLSIALSFVTLQDGSITAASEGRNKGATFTVEFPALAASAGPAAAERRPQPAPRLDGIRVGLVMWDEDACDAIGGPLRRLGADVRTSTSQMWFAGEIDVMVADVDVPPGQAPRRAGHLTAGLTVKSIALTARTDQDLALGFDLVIRKPVVPRELAVHIAHIARTANIARTASSANIASRDGKARRSEAEMTARA